MGRERHGKGEGGSVFVCVPEWSKVHLWVIFYLTLDILSSPSALVSQRRGEIGVATGDE